MTATESVAGDPFPPTADVVQLPPSVFFGERGGLVVPRLGGVIQDAGEVKVGFDGRLYRYDHGVYLADGDTFARVMVRELLGDKCKRSHFDEVITWLRSHYPTIGTIPPTQWINVTNGLLEWRTGELQPHTPEVLSTVQIPVVWDPAATCEVVDRFLGEVLPDETTISLIEEWAGYLLYPGNPFRLALLLLGPGRNGKSKLLALLKALAGNENCSAVPLQDLAENRFAKAQLFGKLANVCGDLDARAIKNTDTFKMATGGDVLTAERKHGQPFEFTPFASFIFGANEAPISSDQSSAWFERWTVVPMEKRIPDDKMDPHLEAKITAADQLSGLLVKAVAGLRLCMTRGRFQTPAAVEKANVDYRERLDSVSGFIAESCIIAAGAWITRPALYRTYRTWSQDNGRSPLSAMSFNDRIRRDHPDTVIEKAIRGARGWSGIGLLAIESAPPLPNSAPSGNEDAGRRYRERKDLE